MAIILGRYLENQPADRDVERCVMVVVARDGIEPPTPAFSGPRSTIHAKTLAARCLCAPDLD
jgi:hypothetical protein